MQAGIQKRPNGKKEKKNSGSPIRSGMTEGALFDYIAMDIKAPLDKYEKIAGVKVNLNNIKKSIKIIMEAGIPYEFRTTVVPGLLNKKDIAKIGELIKGAEKPPSAHNMSFGEAKWYLQFFKSDIDLVDAGLKGKKAFGKKEMEEMAEIGKKYVKRCEIR